MNWSSWSEFLAMGGYALYVWGAYALAMVVLVFELALLWLRRRNIERHLGGEIFKREKLGS